MDAPETTMTVAGCTVTLLGTIPGFVPDGDRVQAAIKAHDPQAIALGVPPEDLASMQALLADPTIADGLEPDELDLHFLSLIAAWGPTRFLPSPDLDAAHAAGRPLQGIDLSDEEHTERFTATVKVRHLVQRSTVRRRLAKTRAEDIVDPYAVARQWDDALCNVTPLGVLEQERERHMATALRALAKDNDRLLAVVHAARFDGVVAALSAPEAS